MEQEDKHMTLDEQAQEIIDLNPDANLTLTQCRVAAIHTGQLGWNWDGASEGFIDLSRDEYTTTRTVTINRNGVYR